MDAAIAGQGVHLAIDTLVQDRLESGLLVRPFYGAVVLDRAYWLVTSEAGRADRQVRQFGTWLDREFAGSDAVVAR
jgi:DNA-binding transcriptional LysR family regulator